MNRFSALSLTKADPARRRYGPNDFEPFRDCAPDETQLKDRILESMRVKYCLGHVWHCKPPWRRQAASFADPLLIWIAAGQCRIRVEHAVTEHTMGPGGMMIIPRNTVHSILPAQRTTLNFIIVHSIIHIFGAADMFQVLRLGGVYQTDQPALIHGLFTEIARECAHCPPGWRALTRMYLGRIMVERLRNISFESLLPTAGTGSRGLVRLLPAFELIERHYPDPTLSISEPARAAGLSEVALRRLFRDRLNLTPVDFIQQRRIAHACRLLRETEEGLKTIAEASGFSDVPYFCRIFRKLTQRTPSQYRHAADQET